MAVPVIEEPFEVYAGDAWAQTFTFKIGDPLELEDLSGGSSWLCHWRVKDTEDTFIVLDVDTSDAAEGAITVSATGEQTRAMGGKGVSDVQAVFGGLPRTLIRFSTTWKRDVTRV